MRRLLSLCLLLVACTTGVPVDTTGPPPASTTTPTEPPTGTTAPSADGLQLTDCSDPDGFELLCESVDLILTRYVDPISPEDLVEAAIRGVEEEAEPGRHPHPITCPTPTDEFVRFCRAVDRIDAVPEDAAEAALVGITRYALDPNSLYLDPRTRALVEEEQSGEVEGIGALVSARDVETPEENDACSVLGPTCRLTVVAVLGDSPAEKAGLRPGDELVAVDGRDVGGLTVDEVTAMVRGPAGTEVELTVRRGEQLVDLRITRARISIPVVEAAMVGEVGYLRLSVFTDDADVKLRDALIEQVRRNARRLVLDLRNNPGGALPAAVGVASLFLDEGEVLRTVGPEGETVYEVRDVGFRTGLPLTVVVNAGSASASEVVAAALQEAGRALVVGERTFGKNTVQQRFSLSNGGALRLTIARWTTPAGADLGGGVSPDVALELPNDLTPEEVVARVEEVLASREAVRSRFAVV
ncbi:MAG: hypothetical protein KatS3mg011_0562 [Acidimicrobiia bacterium]|nr:MAG: hypothetical protein KatS3mg011_0562 [Acidimicrobiia bacterium]